MTLTVTATTVHGGRFPTTATGDGVTMTPESIAEYAPADGPGGR